MFFQKKNDEYQNTSIFILINKRQFQIKELHIKIKYQMGKKQTPNEKAHKMTATIPINKNKTLSANMNKYIQCLRAKHSTISTKVYLTLLHKYIQRCTRSCSEISQKIIVQNTHKIKICRKCDQWAINKKKMIQCIQCEDYYHIQCIQNDEQFEKDEWICQNCYQMNQRKFRKQEQNAVIHKKQRICNKCGEQCHKNKTMIKCLKCDFLYHQKCYGKKVVVCSLCDKEIQLQMKDENTKQIQLTLPQYFAKIKSKKVQLIKEEVDESTIGSQTVSTVSANSRFTSQFPKMKEQEIQKYKKNLLYAILTKSMKYTEELQPQNCSLQQNNEDSLDFAITHLSYIDYQRYLQYKKQPIGPFLLQYREEMGYDVIADKALPKGMIICQYLGDVYTHRSVLERQRENDSIMELKVGRNADQSLFIVPKLYSNIARFINGINNVKGGKPNVSTIRAIGNGKPVVILYTARRIKKGESLIYDYNAGSNPVGYDTSYFV